MICSSWLIPIHATVCWICCACIASAATMQNTCRSWPARCGNPSGLSERSGDFQVRSREARPCKANLSDLSSAPARAVYGSTCRSSFCADLDHCVLHQGGMAFLVPPLKEGEQLPVRLAEQSLLFHMHGCSRFVCVHTNSESLCTRTARRVRCRSMDLCRLKFIASH